MGPREAALAAGLLGVEDVVPIHYGTFPILTGTPEQLRTALDERGLSGVRSTRRNRAGPSADHVLGARRRLPTIRSNPSR